MLSVRAKKQRWYRPEKSLHFLMNNPVLSLQFFLVLYCVYTFIKIEEKLLLFACGVGMWETRRVFHISTPFSFFASFFLFAASFLFVNNSGYRPVHLPFVPAFPAAFDWPGPGMGLFRCHHIYTAVRPDPVIDIYR